MALFEEEAWLTVAEAHGKYVVSQTVIRQRVKKGQLRSSHTLRGGREVMTVNDVDLAKQFFPRFISNALTDLTGKPASNLLSKESNATGNGANTPIENSISPAVIAAVAAGIAGSVAGKLVETLFGHLLAFLKLHVGESRSTSATSLIEQFDAKFPNGDETGSTVKQQFDRKVKERIGKTISFRAAASIATQSRRKLSSREEEIIAQFWSRSLALFNEMKLYIPPKPAKQGFFSRKREETEPNLEEMIAAVGRDRLRLKGFLERIDQLLEQSTSSELEFDGLLAGLNSITAEELSLPERRLMRFFDMRRKLQQTQIAFRRFLSEASRLSGGNEIR